MEAQSVSKWSRFRPVIPFLCEDSYIIKYDVGVNQIYLTRATFVKVLLEVSAK